MDITIGQILTWLNHHWIQILVWLIAIDNILITACAAAGWDRAETFFKSFAKFLGAILVSCGKGIHSVTTKQQAKSDWEFLLLVCCVLICGCAIIIKRPATTIDITNAAYSGTYCPGGCTANIHYSAGTDIELRFLDDPNNGLQNNSSK